MHELRPEPECREVFLVVRPEERRAVERTLQGLIGSAYVTLPVLGRGGPAARVTPKTFHTSLPKALFFLVVPVDEVDELLAAVGATLRSQGGPADCGHGLGLVLPLEDVHDIGDFGAGEEVGDDDDGRGS
jgi:nitrogen regulatory protein PII